MRWKKPVFAMLSLFVSLSAAKVNARTPEQEASRLESAGEALFEAGKYAEALKKFEEVVTRYDRPAEVIRAARWNIARCHEEMGDEEAALRAFEEFERIAVTADEKQDAAAKVSKLRERRLASLEVEVTPEGAEVRVDGQEVGLSPLGTPLSLPPGRHVVSARKAGFRPGEEVVDLGPRERRAVRLVLEAMRGRMEVRGRGGDAGDVVVVVDGREVHRGSLPVTVEVPAGRRQVQVLGARLAAGVDREVLVPDGGVARVEVEAAPVPVIGPAPVARPPAEVSEVVGPEESRPAPVAQVSLTGGAGFMRARGETLRTHGSLEVLGGFRPLRWLQADLGLAVSVESPVAVLLRPGVRLRMTHVPVFLRVAAQVALRPSTLGGVLFGAGGEVPLGAGVSLGIEMDAALWPSDPSLIPVEFRLGVAYAF